MVLAVPGTIVHAALGHIDWAVVAVFGHRTPAVTWAPELPSGDPGRLERVYGATFYLLGRASWSPGTQFAGPGASLA